MSGERRSGRAGAILSTAVVFLLATTVSQAKYSGGTGEPNDPYRIATAEDLNRDGLVNEKDFARFAENWGWKPDN